MTASATLFRTAAPDAMRGRASEHSADGGVATPTRGRDLTVAILLSCDTFESFFGKVLGVDAQQYVSRYRNDWSWYYAAGLIKNGFRVLLYVPSLHSRGRHETDAGVAVRFLPTASWYRPLAPLRRASRATRWSLYAQERINAMSFARPLRESLAADGVDVLFNQEYWGGRFDHLLADASRTSGVPVVGMDQGGVPDGTVRWFKRRTFARAAAILSQSGDEVRRVAAFGTEPRLQPNGGDVSFFSPPPPDAPPRTKTILTVARLTDKQKRTSDLIRAVALLDDDWSLDVVGTGPDLEFLKAVAGDAGVAGRVRFLGFKGRDEVRDLYRRCGVYAMPSSNEAVCLALLEAMACGAAVVATRIRTFTALVDDGVAGLLVPVADPAALAAAIDAAWLDRDALGREAVRSVTERFDADTLYRQLADRLRDAAGLRGAHRRP